jgi:hypothetical protein
MKSMNNRVVGLISLSVAGLTPNPLTPKLTNFLKG